MNYSEGVMPKERALTVRVETDLAARMEALRVRYGMPFSEQIRRALKTWLELNEQAPTLMGAVNRAEDRRKSKSKAERKRANTRKRS
jgi:hypothetical protein